MMTQDQQFRLNSLSTEMTSDENKKKYDAYDHTKLSAINTCPTWGILRYTMHKAMGGTARAMALEAGGAAHECFSAIRWYQFHSRQVEDKTGASIAEKQGIRIFGEDRFEKLVRTISGTATDRTNLINVSLEALDSSGFYDDISDNRRTKSNISESIIAYIDHYDLDRYPIWVRDSNDPSSVIGIENPFDMLVTVDYDMDGTNRTKTIRYTGKLDGLHWNKDNLVIIEEKTGARIDEHWLAQWMLSHQITGYCVAASTFTGNPCTNAIVSGTRLPIGKVPHEGIRKELVPRNEVMIEKWANWLVTTVEVEETWKNQVINAPMYTHSCNRYFRSCAFLPFCASDDVEEKEQIISEMVDDEWSPLHEPV